MAVIEPLRGRFFSGAEHADPAAVHDAVAARKDEHVVIALPSDRGDRAIPSGIGAVVAGDGQERFTVQRIQPGLDRSRVLWT
ncbi:hypothetical protein [Actinomadura sp. 3N508]|uniref:hypothetical protein n=1 Tax=Actinomadura sp. 3N508 TaxID=3375153 RepID=UPI00378EDA7B